MSRHELRGFVSSGEGSRALGIWGLFLRLFRSAGFGYRGRGLGSRFQVDCQSVGFRGLVLMVQVARLRLSEVKM